MVEGIEPSKQQKTKLPKGTLQRLIMAVFNQAERALTITEIAKKIGIAGGRVRGALKPLERDGSVKRRKAKKIEKIHPKIKFVYEAA